MFWTCCGFVTFSLFRCNQKYAKQSVFDGSWSHVCHEHREFDRNGGREGRKRNKRNRFDWMCKFIICEVIATAAYFYELERGENVFNISLSYGRCCECYDKNVSRCISITFSAQRTMGSRKMCCMRNIRCGRVPCFPHFRYRRMRDTVQIAWRAWNEYPRGRMMCHSVNGCNRHNAITEFIMNLSFTMFVLKRRYIYLTRKTNNTAFALCILLLLSFMQCWRKAAEWIPLQ